MVKMSEFNSCPSTADEKKRLRHEILSIRNAMPKQERQGKSGQIMNTVYSMEVYRAADVILAYADYQSEVMTLALIENALIEGKKVFCPKVMGDDMDFYRINSLEELVPGYKGIREPVSGRDFLGGANAFGRPLALMPGVAFDKDCHRLGYGKGFYDRYMTRLSEKGIDAYKLGLGYECQMVHEVPYEAHDIKLDMVVTENNVY